jgi:hypothetical protein
LDNGLNIYLFRLLSNDNIFKHEHWAGAGVLLGTRCLVVGWLIWNSVFGIGNRIIIGFQVSVTYEQWWFRFRVDSIIMRGHNAELVIGKWFMVLGWLIFIWMRDWKLGIGNLYECDKTSARTTQA